MLLFSLFSLLFAACSAQQLIDLKTFRGGQVKNILNAPMPYGIYVSAHSDSQTLLNQIYVNTNDGKSISLYKLKTMKLLQNSGQLQPYAITNSSAYVTTTLSDSQMNSLKGLMFISTTAQLTNLKFYVIDVDGSQNVDLTGIGNVDSTVLFLNTNYQTSPFQSSVISSWKQDANALAYLYRGVPTDTAEAKDTQIFSNPMHTRTFDGYFDNVEKFSLSLGAFYIKTYKGFKFVLQPGYYDIDKMTTTSTTTTGFYMKPVNVVDRTTTINTRRDTKYSGSVGFNTVGNIPAGASVDVGEYEGASSDSISFPPTNNIFPWSSPHIGQSLRITSTGAQTGEFFCQYYVVQGPLASGTTAAPSPNNPTIPPNNPTIPPVNPTSSRVQTTTKSSQSVQLFLSSIVAVFGARFL